MTYRFLSREEALKLLQLAGEVWDGTRALPPEIVAKKEAIEAAIKNAELFIGILRVVDYGMVDDIVDMKLELDALYGRWAASESESQTVH